MSGGWSKQIFTVKANFAKLSTGNSARLSTKAELAREGNVGVRIIAKTKVGMGRP